MDLEKKDKVHMMSEIGINIYNQTYPPKIIDMTDYREWARHEFEMYEIKRKADLNVSIFKTLMIIVFFIILYFCFYNGIT